MRDTPPILFIIPFLRIPSFWMGLNALTRLEDIHLLRPLRHCLMEPFLAVVLGFLCILPFAVLRRRVLLVTYLTVFSVAYLSFLWNRATPIYYVSDGYSGSAPDRSPSSSAGSCEMGEKPDYYVYDPNTHPDAPNTSNAYIYLLFSSPMILACLYHYLYRRSA